MNKNEKCSMRHKKMTIFDFNNFIRFGNILNKEQRETLVSYWFFKNKKETEYRLNSKYFNDLAQYFALIDNIINEKSITEIINQNENIFQDISTRVFNIFEKVNLEVNLKGPFLEEELRLIEWKKTDKRNFYKKIMDLFEEISKYYSDEESNIQFYKKEYEKILLEEKKQKSEEKEQKKLKKEALRREIFGKWEILLNKKKHLLFLEKLDNDRIELCKKLYQQIENLEKMMKLLKPFTNELGRLWDLSSGNWKIVDFNILEKYAELLAKEPEIQKLAEYLGRMHDTQAELEEEKIKEMRIQTKMKINHAGKSELVGVHESDDINNLLPSEISLLSEPQMEMIFYKKFAEKKLLTYQFISQEKFEELIEEEKTKKIPKKDKRGPIIICVDTSGSMHGIPEYVAKVLCFAILRIALMNSRRCYLISFSTKIKTLDLTNLNASLMELIEFLMHSFHGGTDATPALTEALKQIKTKEYSKADILMISDFIMNNVKEPILSEIQNCKKDGTRFHSLVISTAGNTQVLEIFDNNWIYNTQSDKPFKDILKNIKYINTEND